MIENKLAVVRERDFVRLYVWTIQPGNEQINRMKRYTHHNVQSTLTFLSYLGLILIFVAARQSDMAHSMVYICDISTP